MTIAKLDELAVLTDAELLSSARLAILSEREAQLSVLDHLIEVERRNLHVKIAYANLYEYAQKFLKYSAGAAHRRIASARLLREHPHLRDLLMDGRLTLTTASILAPLFKGLRAEEATGLAQKAAGKSQDDVLAMVAMSRPRAAQRERIVVFATPGPAGSGDGTAPSQGVCADPTTTTEVSSGGKEGPPIPLSCAVADSPGSTDTAKVPGPVASSGRDRGGLDPGSS